MLNHLMLLFFRAVSYKCYLLVSKYAWNCGNERLLFVPFKLNLVAAKHALEKSTLAVKSFAGLFVVNELLGVLILNMLVKTHDFFCLFL